MAAGSQVQLVNHYDYDAPGYIKLLFHPSAYFRCVRFLRRTEHTWECVSCQDGLWGFLRVIISRLGGVLIMVCSYLWGSWVIRSPFRRVRYSMIVGGCQII